MFNDVAFNHRPIRTSVVSQSRCLYGFLRICSLIYCVCDYYLGLKVGKMIQSGCHFVAIGCGFKIPHVPSNN